ncbi:LPXTG cell wall anchor domain-containing protein [Corynebacterium incognita]|uniref:LPXTG cell wall anchor domain-containing protein n=1 Tax=Corynebacterium incognita TaxID=2754725 RepID=A0A7G7CSQ6_9CORY|nr:LPXTG cell wall anchor domain-containing protein [Corynebacterium incognita]QNE90622.1 LPXTG cell wall anchor domain-containing protein [Corynebacterium incognita]
MRSKISPFVAFACATGLSLSIFVGPALADARTVTGDVSAISVAAIDPSRAVSLSLQMTHPNPYNDQEPGQLPQGPMGGHIITVSRVSGVDLTTVAGWETAKKLTVAQAREKGLAEAARAQTDDSGRVSFFGLTPGLYLVEETVPSNPDVEYVATRPFLVTLPIGDGQNGVWDYDVELLAKTDKVPPGETTPPETLPETPTMPPFTPPDTPKESTPPEEPGPGPSDPPVVPTTSTSSVTPAPPVSGIPGEPGEPQGPLARALASTGASVVGLVLVAGGLVALGAVLSRRRKEDS